MTMEMKLDALKGLDKGNSVNKITMDSDVVWITLIGWKTKRPRIETWHVKRACTDSLKERKSMKGGECKKSERGTFFVFTTKIFVFRQEREQGTTISGPILQKKALKFYDEFQGEPGFTVSAGWLDKWENRYNIRQLNICGEKLSANLENAAIFMDNFHKLVKKEGMPGDQIYNCDKTGLNFRMLLLKTLASREETSAPGYKRHKERITILASINATGS
ncbi:jerky protein homolog-like [Stegodyphus dumicola]|uniref:jerky protein homolog-like n=1 Tax=Stegodyphus dumicola TaxID=202533 RepID=UPI0015B34747|nr:jerky protein homolog-like [Stegodyphus dumicola]